MVGAFLFRKTTELEPVPTFPLAEAWPQKPNCFGLFGQFHKGNPEFNNHETQLG